MQENVLVAYATRYGSTKEVAVAVGDRLRQRGLQAEVRSVSELYTLEGYTAVVLAAPFYVGSLLKDARRFLMTHRASLEHMPVALLTLGPITADEDLAEARKQIDTTLQKFPWLKPVTAEMFVGKYDPERLRWLDKLATVPKASPLHGMGARDDRDWAAINAWADSLPELLITGGRGSVGATG